MKFPNTVPLRVATYVVRRVHYGRIATLPIAD